MEMDFSGPAPQVKTLEEAQQIIDALWRVCGEFQKAILELKAENTFLKKKVAELEEKLNTNSRNSSNPPSSDKPNQKNSNAQSNNQNNRGKRNRGGQQGHEGHARKLLPPEEVDKFVVCDPAKQCVCGGLIHKTGGFRPHQSHELPKVRAVVTEYQLHYGTCCACGKVYEASLPTGVPTGILGAYAISKLSVLTGDYHLSKREASHLLFDFYGLDVSLGTVVNAEQTVSESVAAAVDEAKEYVKIQPVVNADETGHKEQGKRYWAWVAVASYVAVFLIRASRGAKIAKELLGESFIGTLISDRCSAYAWVMKRQLCWSHLIRDFVKIAERSGEASRIGLLLLAYSKRFFRYWSRFREGNLTRQRFQELMQGVIKAVESLLLKGSTCGESKTQNTCKRLLKLKKALWAFVWVDGLEPTNNLAERTIRPLVIWRKKSFGTQSEGGSRYLERIMTVASSCHLQGRNVLDFVEQSVQAHFNQHSPPSLLPGVELTGAIKAAA